MRRGGIVIQRLGMRGAVVVGAKRGAGWWGSSRKWGAMGTRQEGWVVAAVMMVVHAFARGGGGGEGRGAVARSGGKGCRGCVAQNGRATSELLLPTICGSCTATPVRACMPAAKWQCKGHAPRTVECVQPALLTAMPWR